MFVYLLLCSDGSTYVGATVNLERRLRQHNKEIKGGARLTGTKVERGKSWTRVCYVSGFPEWRAALQFEWRWKQISRKQNMSYKPLERRLMALNELLFLDRPTSKSVAYCEWENKPTVHIEQEVDLCSIYLQLCDDAPFNIV